MGHPIICQLGYKESNLHVGFEVNVKQDNDQDFSVAQSSLDSFHIL